MTKASTERRSQHDKVGEALASVLPDDGLPWYRKRHLVWLSLYCVGLSLLSAANGYDGSMMNGLQALPQWVEFMDHPKGSWLGFINASQALSTALSYPFIAYFGNRWGRKKGLFIGYIFLVLGSCLQGFVPNDTGFIIARLFIGQPSAWWSGLAPLLITELAYPTHRGFFTALFNCGWYVGSTLAAWATFGTRNYQNDWAWRIPSLLQMALPAVALPAVLLVPESPRYLISKGEIRKARKVLTDFHAGGDDNSPLVEFEMAEISQAIEAEHAIAVRTTWAHLFSTKGNRHRAFISISLGIFAQWNGVNVVSFYLALILTSIGITSVTHQTLISGCLQVWNLILAVSAAASVDRFGRRKLFLTSCIGMLACFIVITGLSGSFSATKASATGVAVVPFLYLYYGFYDIAFTPLIVAYPAEIWSYELRARGLALMNMSAYSAIFFNVFVNPIALNSIGWRYYIVFIALLILITITIYFLYPETKGNSLEEMVKVFDGHDAPINLAVESVQLKDSSNVVHKENV